MVRTLWGLLNPYGADPYAGAGTGLSVGKPDEVIAISELMGRRSFLTFTPEEPEYVWHSDVTARRGDTMGVVPSAAQKMIQLPLVSIAATILLILFLAAAVKSGKMPRGLVAGASLTILLVGIVWAGSRSRGNETVLAGWGSDARRTTGERDFRGAAPECLPCL